MTTRQLIARIIRDEDLNFLLTNRIPRIQITRFMGWFSQIENPLVRDLSMAIWRLFTDLDLSDAKKSAFKSLHDCFTRELRPEARAVDADSSVLTSPCDAIVGACGAIDGDAVFQAKGFPYKLADLFGDAHAPRVYQDGCFVTLRLTSAMYHRFHAMADAVVEQVTYITGDTWNVNPIALQRIERLFCRNERAVIRTRLRDGGYPITLVPVAAVLVASMRLHCVNVLLNLRYRGPNVMRCNAAYAKGQELGWFEHGSTIIVFAPPGFVLCEEVTQGTQIRMGQRLMRRP